MIHYTTIPGGILYTQLYMEAPLERDTFFRLQVPKGKNNSRIYYMKGRKIDHLIVSMRPALSSARSCQFIDGRRLPVTNILYEIGMLRGYYFSMEGTGIPFLLQMVYKRARGRPDLGSKPSRMQIC